MGKSKESKVVNKDLSKEYDYQQKQRSGINSYWDPKIDASASYLPEDRSNYTRSLGNLEDLSNSFMGGVAPIDTSAMKGDAGTYRNFAQGNTETGKFFRNLMNTGGYSEGELGDIRQAGTRIIPSFFANLRNQMRTAQNATGGYSPGYSASAAAMARDAAHQSQNAALDTELGISDRVRQGKLTGAGSLNEMFLGGMSGASGLEKAIAEATLQSQGLDLQSRSIGAGLLGQASSGYGNLLSKDQDFYLQNEAMKLRAQGMSDDQISQNLGIRAQYNPNKGGFNWGGALQGAGSGAASGSVFGPWGAVAGGLIGGVSGGLKG